MRKLDEKLARAVRREREVKQQRKLLEQRMQEGDKASLDLVKVESGWCDCMSLN